MRWLKKLLTALLIYIGVYLPFVVVVQSITGYDFTAAYVAVTGVGAVELIISGLIKREETKNGGR
jgi:multidrug transporter EmrE-like cation transporter